MPKRLSIGIAAIPAIALTFAIVFVNRDEPHILGMPFIFAWLVMWIIIVPAFLWFIHYKVEGRR